MEVKKIKYKNKTMYVDMELLYDVRIKNIQAYEDEDLTVPFMMKDYFFSDKKPVFISSMELLSYF